MKLKRIAAAFMSLTMMFSFADMPQNENKVYAEQAYEITYKTAAESNLIGGQQFSGNTYVGDFIYFGKFNGSPIKWRILKADGTNMPDDESTTNINESEGMFLLSEYCLADNIQFHNSSNTYEGSDVDSWCENTLYGGNGNFTDEEKAAVMKTSKTENAAESCGISWKECTLTDDHMFLPSAQEISDYISSETNAKRIAKTSNEGGSAAYWWLRSPDANIGEGAGLVSDVGTVIRGIVYNKFAVRPAFNLDKSKIGFYTQLEEHEWAISPTDAKTITFDCNYEGDTDYQVKTDFNGKAATIPTPTERTGYTFEGWYEDAEFNTPLNIDKVYSADATVYAKWKAIPPSHVTGYTVTWDIDGNTSTEPYIENSTVTYKGDTPTKAEDESCTYVFKGWDKPFTTVHEDLTYTAVFEAIPKGTQPIITSTTQSTTTETTTSTTVTTAQTTAETAAHPKVSGITVDNGAVSWLPAEGAVAYKVEKIVDGEDNYGSKVTGTSYKLNHVPEKDYFVRVVAFFEDGAKTWSDAVLVGVDDKLGIPTNVKAEGKKITWTAAENAVEYKIKKIWSNGNEFFGKETAKTEYALNNAQKNMQIVVVAYGKNNQITYSAPVLVSDVKKATDIKIGTDKKTVTWTGTDTAVKYQLVKYINGGKHYTKFVTDTEAEFSNAVRSGEQVFVIAFDSKGNRSYSDAILVD